jgi:hypothetical protein
LFNARGFRSDALGPLDSIGHPLAPGSYGGTVFRKEQQLGTFVLEIAEGGDGEQIEVDFADFELGVKNMQFAGGSPKGEPVYLVLHTSGEGSGYYAIVTPHKDKDRVFDTRRLGDGDYYIVVPPQPGTYGVKSEGYGGKGRAGGSCRLVVEPVKPGAHGRDSAHGATARVGKDGIDPAKLAITSGDGAVFAVVADGIAIRGEKEGKPPKRTGKRPVGARIPGRAVRDTRSG